MIEKTIKNRVNHPDGLCQTAVLSVASMENIALRVMSWRILPLYPSADMKIEFDRQAPGLLMIMRQTTG
jgi:hypothetical protein